MARICSSSQMHSAHMSFQFSRSFRNSRQLSSYANVVFMSSGKDFDEGSIVKSIQEIKFPTCDNSTDGSTDSLIASSDPLYREVEIMRANLALCLQSIRFYNRICRELYHLKATSFDWTAEGMLI